MPSDLVTKIADWLKAQPRPADGDELAWEILALKVESHFPEATPLEIQEAARLVDLSSLADIEPKGSA